MRLKLVLPPFLLAGWSTGDPKIFGRVHLATSGRGIGYGDLRVPGLDSGEGER